MSLKTACTSIRRNSDGNPIVYTYAVFPAFKGTGGTSYKVNITVASGDGTTATQSQTVSQGQGVPIIINSATTTPGVLAATDTSFLLTVNMAVNGPNQAGYLTGAAFLYDQNGNGVGVGGFQTAGMTHDSNGNLIATTTFSNLPVNTSSSPKNYTLTIEVKDKTAVWTYKTITVTQLAGSVTIAPSSTSLAVASASGTVGQSATLSATLTAGSAPVSGQTVSFQVDGVSVGTAATNGSGVASLTYAILATANVGSHTIAASFAGNSADAASSGTGTLTAIAAPPAATSLAVASASGTVGQSATLSATLTAGSAPVSGQTVSFQVDGVSVGTAATNGSGVASLTYAILATANVGSHTIAASFAGNSADAASSGTGTLTAAAVVVTGVSTSLTAINCTGKAGQTLHLIGRLRRNTDHTALAGEKLTFSVDGVVVGTVAGTVQTNSAGFAVDYYQVPNSLAVGNHTLTAAFAGDSAYLAASANSSLTITN